jgi:hypothetical protein
VNFITVVSGLPRSGTSLMMQMLVAGGMQPLTDHLRLPDEDNPRGYLEYEPVKRTRQDSSWVPLATGKVVKVVTALLADLPLEFDYRIVLMNRPLHEVLRSQRVMLERSGKPAAADDDRLERVFTQQLRRTGDYLSAHSCFRVLPVGYHSCLYRTSEVVMALRAFLELELDSDAMSQAVDRSLHRNIS